MFDWIGFFDEYNILVEIQLMEQQAARAAAKRLYQKINFTGGALQSYQISTLLTDTYQYLNIPYKPTTRDIKTYTDVLDVNKDGQVTLADIQQLAINYLCGPGVLNNHSLDPNYKNKQYQNTTVSSATYSTSNIRPNSYVQQVYNEQHSINNKKQNRPTSQQNASSYQQQNIPERQYNAETMKYLSITKDIFKNCAGQYFTITARQVPQVLAQTYETLGRKGYKPNEQDVRVWMKLCDSNGDGHVEYAEYEYFVARSLQRSGFEIYQ